MKIRLVGSMIDVGPPHQQFAASLLVNHTIAIDAGSIGFLPSVSEQRRIRHVFLTHSHQDHIASLPMFLDNAYDGSADGVSVYGHEETLAALQRHVFNGCIWPDFVRLSSGHPPFLTLKPLTAGQAVAVDGLQVTAVTLDHTVPTLGYVVEDERTSVAVISDTASSDVLWNMLADWPRPLSGLFLECSFPNRLRALADQTRHLTPEQIPDVCQRLPQCSAVVAIHIKPAHASEVVGELCGLGLPQLVVGQANSEYTF